MRLPFKPQHRLTQRSFIQTDRARRCKRLRVTTPAAHLPSHVRCKIDSERQRTTLPANRLGACKDSRRFPTHLACNPKPPLLHTPATDETRLRIRNCKQSIVNTREEHD